MSEKAYQDGRDAYAHDAKRQARQRQNNPYESRGSHEDREDWNAGYDDAREEANA